MSSNLVIVAIPSEDDYVWKISSEKVPHMTLLFLGEATDNPYVSKIAEFVEHAASLQTRFGLEVERRGTLGLDEADVLFFDKKWAKPVEDFRAQLLQFDPIKTSYDSVEQFDGWTPHLTLGYPETPAHEDKRDYPGIHWVNFDKLALWFGDYQGVEFPLKPYDYSMEVMMGSSAQEVGETAVADILHFGVKGMKWGVRKAEKGKASPDAARAAKAHAKLKEKGIHSLSNDELQALSKRIEMERKVKDINSPVTRVKQGHDFVKLGLGIVGTVNALLLLSQSPIGKAVLTKKSPQGTLF